MLDQRLLSMVYTKLGRPRLDVRRKPEGQGKRWDEGGSRGAKALEYELTNVARTCLRKISNFNGKFDVNEWVNRLMDEWMNG